MTAFGYFTAETQRSQRGNTENLFPLFFSQKTFSSVFLCALCASAVHITAVSAPLR
jgi:hypothetical protein